MATYKIDPTHSEVTFKVKHLMITNVTGNFTQFEATMDSSKEDFTDAKISFSADVNSVTTHNEQRDGHLKTGDFFAVDQYPKLGFTSTAFEKKSGNEYKLRGDLTLRGVTKPVELDVEYNGTTNDPYGQTKSGFEINGKIDRKDFGMTFSAATEAGGLVVGDEVKLHIQAQMVKQA